MRFAPGVDTRFSHESSKSTECVKIELFLQEHSPLIRVQVDRLFCTMSIQIKEHTAKRYKISVNRSTFGILLSAYIKRVIFEKKSGPSTYYLKAQLLCTRLANEYEETFTCF